MNVAELEGIRESALKKMDASKAGADTRVVVGLATCGIAAGASPVLKAFVDDVSKRNLKQVDVSYTGCIGVCRLEPMVDVFVPGKGKVTYVHMTPEKVARVVEEHLVGGKTVEEYTITHTEKADKSGEHYALDDVGFYKAQMRVALRNCGLIDPESVEDYIGQGGYKALAKALTEMSREAVIDEIKRSGLRGRGGGGFPAGLKWEFTYKAQSDKKYVCCNADEGDPGAFMDRSILEGDPHSVVEAMAIAGYAVGADEGYIYVRAEYPIAVKRLQIAIDKATECGLLGDNIFGAGFNFRLYIRLGAGAFVCGEETALIASIEGKRGEPRPRPPFPAVKGLFGKPTLLNNVETYANICQILLRGADWFAGIGSEKSKGTKVFALGGKIVNTGLAEIPMGTPLRKVIYDIGGGIPDGKAFKAVQTGGPSGGCIPAALLDTPIDYDSLISIGSMMGSGGMIVMDEDNCMVDIARYFLDFTVEESCGKCTPCRIGTRRMLEILERITEGKGRAGDIEKLELLAHNIKGTALCGLGQTAPNPVLSTLHQFRHEYEAHINEKKCPAAHCTALLSFVINDKCIGCSLCARACPVNCISGEIKKKYIIDQDKCIKCGVCMDKCKFGAIDKK